MRDAAKRAPAQSGAAGTSARANANVNPVGDWTTLTADPNLFWPLGTEIVKQRASAGDREAQWSLGCRMMSEAKRAAGQGLYLLHFSAQLEGFAWHRGCA